MSIPFWYEALWACSALGYFAVCIAILITRSLFVWPSVFTIALNRAGWFLIGRVLLSHYKLYFYGYYTEAWVLTGLDLWLAFDIFRSLPASRHFDRRFRMWTLGISASLGVVVAVVSVPRGDSVIDVWLARMGLTFNLTLAGMAFSALIWFAINGLGFSGTGFGITAGALVRLSSSLVKSHAAVSAKAHNLPMSRTIQTIDLIVSLGVAVYWTYVIVQSTADETRRRREWARAAEQLGEASHA